MLKRGFFALLLLTGQFVRAGENPFTGPDPSEWEYAPGKRALLYQPPQRDPGLLLPAIIMVHGGAWKGGSPELMDPLCRYLASRGLVVLAPEYRLTREDGVTVFDCIADVRTAIAKVRSEAKSLGVDASKIAAAGDSAGGHLVACAGGIPGLSEGQEKEEFSSRPDAMILFYPILNTVPPDGWDLAKDGGKAGETVATRAREFSPVHHVSEGMPPTLILHGDADTITPLRWSEQYAEKMRASGNRVDLIVFPGEDHAFMIRGYGSDRTMLDGLEKISSFLQSLWEQPQCPLWRKGSPG